MTTRSPERQRVGGVIRDRRRELKVSQEVMARRVGLTLAGYRPWEYGERDLRSEDLPVWAEALELTRAELTSRLGLAPVSVQSVYAAEVTEMLEQIADPSVRDEMMTAIRAVVRAVQRSGQSEDAP